LKILYRFILSPSSLIYQFTDPDFGPNDDDEYGAESLYGNPPVRPGASGASSYPAPERISWIRPHVLILKHITVNYLEITIP